MIRRAGPALLRAIAILSLALLANAQAQTVNFMINSVGDAPKSASAGTGQCNTGASVGGVPECTLRAAIQAANERSGQINFLFDDIPVGSNQFSFITVGSALPVITSRVEIRGQTHPGWLTGRANVVLRASASGAIQAYDGLRFGSGSDGSRVENIGVALFNDGLVVNGANNISIIASYLGGGRTGALLMSRNGRDGIRLINASQTLISNSVIRGNGRHGIHIASGSSGNVITGNRIGVHIDGTNLVPAPLSANDGAGIHVASTAGTGNQLGFLSGNYIANNGEGAIRVLAPGQLITGNRIGVPPDNGPAPGYTDADYANGGPAAIAILSNDNQIGTSGATGNIIGNANQAGIRIGQTSPSNVTASNNQIIGNRIGLDDNDAPYGMNQGVLVARGSGTIIRNNIIANNITGIDTLSGSSGTEIRSNQLLDNEIEGIRLVGGATVGGDSFASANVIGGSFVGINVFGSTSFIVINSNYVGTNASAELLGNSTGISIVNNSGPIDIGQAGRGNVIANSAGNGILLASGALDVWVQSNYIGIHPDGTPMGNLNGIQISGADDAFENRIGYRITDTIDALDFFLSPVAGSRGNLIAHNAQRGVWVNGGDGAVLNSIRGNRFFGNGGRDIDLGMDSLDIGGSATGPNTQLNWPEISSDSSFDPATGAATIVTRVQTAASNASYPLRLDLYWVNPLDTSQSSFITTIEYPVSAAGQPHSQAFFWPAGLPFSGRLVATASDNATGPFANTSQFSFNHPFTQGLGALATTVSNNGATGIYLDLEAISGPVRITGFDLAFSGDAGTEVEVDVYVRNGSYEGEESNASAWQLHETLTYTRAGNRGMTGAVLQVPLQLQPGQIRGIYLHASSTQGIRYTGSNTQPPRPEWADLNLRLFSNVGAAGSSPFEGTLFPDRNFAGIVRYDIDQSDALFQDRFE